LLLYLISTHGAIGVSHTGKEHAQIFVYLCTGAHGRARIAAAHFLLYGYGWRNAFDIVALGLYHAAQELTSITGKTLHISALALGIKSIKGKAGFSRTRNTRDNNQFVTRYLYVYILEVVYSGAFYLDTFHRYGVRVRE
jgi:hypothetical protein